MKKSQIIIGTASWGSKINFSESIDIGNKIISMGLNYFDTAPNYGGGYSHYILNRLAKSNNIFVDTKYGQEISLNPKEIVKRFYRFTNFKSFKQSFKYIQFDKTQRNSESFWSIQELEKHLNLFREDLKCCEIKTFYLHSPPYGILNRNYLEKFNNFFEDKKILPGISWPDIKDLDLLLNNFPDIKLQLSIDSFWNSKDKIIKKIKNLNINSIFKKIKNNKILDINYKNKFRKDLIQILDNNDKYKIVLGINSNESVEKLKKIIINFNEII